VTGKSHDDDNDDCKGKVKVNLDLYSALVPHCEQTCKAPSCGR